MLNTWDLLGKFKKNIYFMIIIINRIYSSFGRSKTKRNVHVNGVNGIGEDFLLKKHLKEDVDF